MGAIPFASAVDILLPLLERRTNFNFQSTQPNTVALLSILKSPVGVHRLVVPVLSSISQPPRFAFFGHLRDGDAGVEIGAGTLSDVTGPHLLDIHPHAGGTPVVVGVSSNCVLGIVGGNDDDRQ